MQISIPLAVLIVVALLVAGALVGRNNPTLAAAADKLVKAGEEKAKAFLAAAKAKLN